jgi:hypothetical protein
MPTRPGSPRSVAAVKAKLTGMAAGTVKHVTPGMVLLVDGKKLTNAKLRALLAAHLKLFQDVEDAAAALQSKLEARAAAWPTIQSSIGNLSMAFRNYLGPENPLLADFSVKHKKPRRQQTALERVASLAQWHGTRKVRGTMGKKQRQAITAEGKPGVIIVDPTGKPMPGGRPPIPPRRK